MEATTWENVGQHYTSDGYEIIEGLTVWNNDFVQVQIVEPCRYGNPAEAQWFKTSDNKIYDGSRMSVRRPW